MPVETVTQRKARVSQFQIAQRLASSYPSIKSSRQVCQMKKNLRLSQAASKPLVVMDGPLLTRARRTLPMSESTSPSSTKSRKSHLHLRLSLSQGTLVLRESWLATYSTLSSMKNCFVVLMIGDILARESLRIMKVHRSQLRIRTAMKMAIRKKLMQSQAKTCCRWTLEMKDAWARRVRLGRLEEVTWWFKDSSICH